MARPVQDHCSCMDYKYLGPLNHVAGLPYVS